MRMAGPDVVLFIVGALLFGGALTAIIVTQGPGAFSGTAGGAGLFTVSWPMQSKDMPKATVGDFAAASATFKVTDANVANVTVKIDCSDSVPGGVAPFALSVTVAGPQGQSGKKDGNCGDAINVPIHVQDAPPGTTVANADQVQASSSTLGQGDWKVTVTGARGSPAGGLPGLPVTQADPSGDIAFSVQTFAPKLDPIAK
ncbi:MAG: hypothetical protein QOE90_2733 [Thermoplasmata archaeon]|jgi:hypothetical protein|nr:hypothetical protein [Thermoplasmata archaeon]